MASPSSVNFANFTNLGEYSNSGIRVQAPMVGPSSFAPQRAVEGFAFPFSPAEARREVSVSFGGANIGTPLNLSQRQVGSKLVVAGGSAGFYMPLSGYSQ